MGWRVVDGARREHPRGGASVMVTLVAPLRLSIYALIGYLVGRFFACW